MLSNDIRYIGRIRALAAQIQNNNAATLKTNRDLINLTVSDARISAEVHVIAEAFGEKSQRHTVPASALVWSDIDNEIERQKKDREKQK